MKLLTTEAFNFTGMELVESLDAQQLVTLRHHPWNRFHRVPCAYMNICIHTCAYLYRVCLGITQKYMCFVCVCLNSRVNQTSAELAEAPEGFVNAAKELALMKLEEHEENRKRAKAAHDSNEKGKSSLM